MATKAKRRKKTKDSMHLVLEGAVYIETRKGSKVTKEPLDGDVVLQCILSVLEAALRERHLLR